MIFWKERLAYLAVPKTGSTAIHAALEPHAAISFNRPPHLTHMGHQRFNRFIRPFLKKEGMEEIELLAVVREPVSWLGSWYRYRQRDELSGLPQSTQGISFDQFVEAYLTEENRPQYAKLGSQARQLAKGKNEIGIDHLFRYEDMESLTAFLANRLGKSVVLPKRNVSPSMDLGLSKQTRARLEEERARDFELYESISK